jgi:hypothetical protein
MPLKDLSFLEKGQPWPPKSERERIDQYTENQRLRDGQFSEAWPDLVKYLRKGQTTEGLSFCLDYPNIITTRTADLIIGNPPDFELPVITNEATGEETENPEESKVTALVERVNFLEILDALIGNVDALGDGVLKCILTIDEAGTKQVKILNIDPYHWFPIVKRGTDEILQHVLAFKYSDKDAQGNDVCYLEVEIHDKKQIEHRLYSLNTSKIKDRTSSYTSDTIQEQLPWDEATTGIKEIEPNPIGDFLVVTCHNQSDGVFGKSSYKPSLKMILKKLIIRYSLENDVEDVFTKPTFFGPQEYAEPDPITKKPTFHPGNYLGIPASDPHSPPPVVPGALVWDAHLGDNQVSKESLLQRLFDMSEMSPVLFASAVSTGDRALSGTALRLHLLNTLAKCSRIKRKVDGAARKALNIGLQLEDTPVQGLFVEWHDSVPRMPMEEAQRFSLFANTPQFAGEIGGQYLLKEFGYSEKEAKAIMQDPTRGGGLGGGM